MVIALSNKNHKRAKKLYLSKPRIANFKQVYRQSVFSENLGCLINVTRYKGAPSFDYTKFFLYLLTKKQVIRVFLLNKSYYAENKLHKKSFKKSKRRMYNQAYLFNMERHVFSMLFRYSFVKTPRSLLYYLRLGLFSLNKGAVVINKDTLVRPGDVLSFERPLTVVTETRNEHSSYAFYREEHTPLNKSMFSYIFKVAKERLLLKGFDRLYFFYNYLRFLTNLFYNFASYLRIFCFFNFFKLKFKALFYTNLLKKKFLIFLYFFVAKSAFFSGSSEEKLYRGLPAASRPISFEECFCRTATPGLSNSPNNVSSIAQYFFYLILLR